METKSITIPVAACVGDTVFFIESRKIYEATVNKITIITGRRHPLEKPLEYDVLKKGEPINDGSSWRTITPDNVYLTMESAKQYIIDTLTVEDGN